MLLGLIAAIVTIIGHLPYMWSALKGRIRPDRSSWGIWTLILAIALWSSFSAGGGASLWFIGGDASAWQLSKLPLLAILAAILADACGVAPTMIKSLRDPHSEQPLAYFSSALATLFGFLAVGRWDWVLLLYPAYLWSVNLITGTIIVAGQWRRSNNNPKYSLPSSAGGSSSC